MSYPTLNYYSNLLIRQYQGKSKAVQTVELMANQSYSDGFIFEEADCFNIDTAIGDQLDIIGRIVGVPRVVYTFDLTKTYFNFTRYNSTPPVYAGFGRYVDSPYDPNGYLFFRYKNLNGISITLTDTEMRTLIRMKIELNNGRPSTAWITDFVYRYLDPDITVTDNKDMTLTYTISTAFGPVGKGAFYLKMLPRPLGVEALYNFV